MEKVSPDGCASENREGRWTGPEKLAPELTKKGLQPSRCDPSPAHLLSPLLLATETVKGIHPLRDRVALVTHIPSPDTTTAQLWKSWTD